MSTVIASPVATRVALPRWPTAMLAMLACLGTLSLLQGVFDIAVPTVLGEQPFGLLFQATQTFGPAFFAVYVFLHNFGLACLVPGFGLVAVLLEKEKRNRKHIATLLSGAVILGLLVGLEFLVQASSRFDLVRVVPLFVAEALGVLILVIPAAREVRSLVPTRTYAWSLVTPMRKLATPLVLSCGVLALASAYETWLVLHL